MVSNAGAHNQDLGQALEWIEVLDARGCNELEGESAQFPVIVLRRYPRESLDLGYRHSRFREQRLTHVDAHGQLVLPPRGLIEPAELVVTLSLRVHRSDPDALKALIEQNQQERQSEDPAQKHLGAIFKNPSGTTAHALIEQVGLAGKTHGGAQISPRNANYIVNQGEAHASDIAALIIEAHQQVLAASGVQLALNVELLGEWEQAK
jgi:UDP-N-acetylmuramate dehydrogenase